MSLLARARTPWTPRRRRGAAVQLVLGGLLMMGVSALVGDGSALAAGFHMLTPLAWLMAVAGAVLLLWPSGPRLRTPPDVPDRPRRERADVAAPLPKATPVAPAGDRFRDTELQYDDGDSRR